MSVHEFEYHDDFHRGPTFACDCGETTTITYRGMCWFPIGHGEDMGECAYRKSRFAAGHKPMEMIHYQGKAWYASRAESEESEDAT